MLLLLLLPISPQPCLLRSRQLRQSPRRGLRLQQARSPPLCRPLPRRYRRRRRLCSLCLTPPFLLRSLLCRAAATSAAAADTAAAASRRCSGGAAGFLEHKCSEEGAGALQASVAVWEAGSEVLERCSGISLQGWGSNQQQGSH